MDVLMKNRNLKYVAVTVMVSMLLVIFLGMKTQQAHAFDDCPTGGSVTPTISQDAVYMMVEELNKRRADLGVPPVKLSSELTNSALYHAIDMQEDNYFHRATFDRDATDELVKQCGIYMRISAFYGDGTPQSLTHAAEMIASGDFASDLDSVNEVLDIMDQIGEYSNLVEDVAWEFGMGYAVSPITGFQKWVLNVGRRDDVFPVIINNEQAETDAQYVNLYMYGDWERVRFQNNSGDWSDWYVFDSEMRWGISTEFVSVQTITAEMVAADGTSYIATDSIEYAPPALTGVGVGAKGQGQATFDPPSELVEFVIEVPLQVGLNSVSSISSGGMGIGLIISFLMGIATVGIVYRQLRNF